jgi:hypothetical protein
MGQPSSLTESLLLLQLCCVVLSGIGWYFGMKIQSLVPAITLGGLAALAPLLIRAAADGVDPSGAIADLLHWGPLRLYSFGGMLLVLLGFGVGQKLFIEPEAKENADWRLRELVPQL